MKRIVLALLFALVTHPAWAGTITFQVAQTGQTTATRAFSIPDAQIDRMIAAYQVAANASVGNTANRAQVLNFIANQVVQGTIVQYVFGVENQNAQASAATGVTPINPQ